MEKISAYTPKRKVDLDQLPAGVSWELSPVFDWVKAPWLLLPDLERHLTVASWVAEIITGFGRPVKILDVGCGFGELGHLLSSWRFAAGVRWKLKGIDADPEKVRIGKELHPSANLNVELAQNLSMDYSSWDIAVSSEVLEHLSLKDGNKMLSRMVKGLAPEGYIIMTWATPELRKHRQNRWHLCERTMEDVCYYLSNLGITITHQFHLKVNSRYCPQSNPNLPRAMRRLWSNTHPDTTHPGASAFIIGQK